MFVVENFIVALANILNMGLTIYMWVIIFRAVISWVSPDPSNPVVIFLYRVTEPVMASVRRWLPLRNIGIDLSPMIIILAIYFLQSFLVSSLMQFALQFR
ncbi:MAG: YggT family protein [Syntrophales bacterium]